MSNYIEYNNTVAFHPGYYIKEIVEESGLTQEDFAKRLNTTPKNLSVLINGEQSLSIDIAMKMARMLGTNVTYWLNLQKKYDALIAEFKSDEELKKEREIFKLIDYKYFKENFGLPDLTRKVDAQIKVVREFLNVSTLNVLEDRNLAVNFRSYTDELTISNIVNANVMVQIAINRALQVEAPKYNRRCFEEAIDYALTLTSKHEEFFPIVQEEFRKAGVILVALPNLKNSGINGATKKIGNKIMLMVNDRRSFADTFWFSMFHEIGHIVNNDFIITFKNQNGPKEDAADVYARNKLIPADAYASFVAGKRFDKTSIVNFAKAIDRDPGLVLGRLQMDGYVSYKNISLANELKYKYHVAVNQ